MSGNAAPESTICLEGKMGIASDVICVPLSLLLPLLLLLLTVVMMIVKRVIVDKNPTPFIFVECQDIFLAPISKEIFTPHSSSISFNSN